MKTAFRYKNRRKERGSVAIEAAIILPLAVVLIFGFLELYNYHRAAAVLDRVAFTVANGVSIQPELYDRNRCTDTDDICVYNTIAKDLLQPLDFTNKGKIEISTWATTTPSGYRPPPVAWKTSPEWRKQYKGGGAGNTAASSRLSSQSFPPPRVDDTVVVVEVFYEHEPFAISSKIWSALGGTTEMYSRFILRPRFNDLRNLSSR